MVLDIEEADTDYLSIIDDTGKAVATSLQYKAGTIKGAFSGVNPPGTPGAYNCISVEGDDNAIEIFKFLADNITGESGIEFGLNLMDEDAETSVNDIFTGYTAAKLTGSKAIYNSRKNDARIFREFIHSHQITKKPSRSDINVARKRFDELFNTQDVVPAFSIYVASIKQFRAYNPESDYVRNNQKKER